MPPMDEPKRIGKYELREYLGGGMARVYTEVNIESGIVRL